MDTQTEPQTQQPSEVKQTQPVNTDKTINLTLADLSNRALALVIDTILLGFVNFFINIAVTQILRENNGIIVSLLTILYYVGMEGFNDGQTLGKMALGIKVTDMEGNTPTIQQIVIRNLLRIVDMLPVFYIVGIIVASNSPLKQRFGDKIAKTVVVKK